MIIIEENKSSNFEGTSMNNKSNYEGFTFSNENKMNEENEWMLPLL
jgi:hypothetical protein